MIKWTKEVVWKLAKIILLSLSILFIVISLAGGVWWRLTYTQYTLSFTLWSITSTFNSSTTQTPITGDKLEEVILTVRACLGIDLLLYFVTVLSYAAVFYLERRNSPPHLWMKIRTIAYLMLVLFLLIPIAHAANCPPAYKLSTHPFTASTSWGWNLALTAFVFTGVVAVCHLTDDFLTWRSDRNKT